MDTGIKPLDYRGIHVEFKDDDYGQQVVGIFPWGDEVGFGAYNCNWEDDAKYLIDERLDVIKRFPGTGGRLEWFTNGYSDHRDIKLCHRSRIVKVWLVDDPTKVDINLLILESDPILEKLEAIRIKNLEKDKSDGTYLSDLMRENK